VEVSPTDGVTQIGEREYTTSGRWSDSMQDSTLPAKFKLEKLKHVRDIYKYMC
jgi:hypothetical protein